MYGVKSFKDLTCDKIIYETPNNNARCIKSMYNNVQKNMTKQRNLQAKVNRIENERKALLNENTCKAIDS